MAFRDDRDALLARAEALEREAERLREENESLRTAADAERAAAEARAETERAVEAKRAEVARMAKRAPAPSRPKPAPSRSRPTGQFGELADDSMSPTWSKLTWVLGFVLLLPAILAVALALIELFGAMRAPKFISVPIGLALFVLYFLGHVFGFVALCGWIARIEARHERRRLAALPIPIDLDGYRRVMGTAQAEKVLEVRVTFATDHPDPDRQTIAAAARAGRRVASAGWSSDELVIRSRPIVTSFHSKKASWNNNVKVHRWFRRLARKTLVPITRAYPMASVRVR